MHIWATVSFTHVCLQLAFICWKGQHYIVFDPFQQLTVSAASEANRLTTPDVTCRNSQRIFLTICFRDNFLNGGELELLRTEAITSKRICSSSSSLHSAIHDLGKLLLLLGHNFFPKHDCFSVYGSVVSSRRRSLLTSFQICLSKCFLATIDECMLVFAHKWLPIKNYFVCI